LQWVGVFLTLVSIYLINQRDNLAGDNTQPALEEASVTLKPLVTEASAKKLNPLAIQVRESKPENIP
jgi:hypothetical protein